MKDNKINVRINEEDYADLKQATKTLSVLTGEKPSLSKAVREGLKILAEQDPTRPELFNRNGKNIFVIEIHAVISREELEQIISDSITKCLNNNLFPAQPEIPDRIGIDDARIILGTAGRPVSRSRIYQLTHLKQIPFKHFRRKLIFSRKELIIWRDENIL